MVRASGFGPASSLTAHFNTRLAPRPPEHHSYTLPAPAPDRNYKLQTFDLVHVHILCVLLLLPLLLRLLLPSAPLNHTVHLSITLLCSPAAAATKHPKPRYVHKKKAPSK